MSTYKLYVKTHNVTGLKYLGFTQQLDACRYPGSGVYWKNHLSAHGEDVSTSILHECESKEELKKLGLYYSELWDVVNATDASGKKIWANLMPESGDGGGGYIFNDADIELISKKSKEAWDKLNDEERLIRVNAAKAASNLPHNREKNSKLSRESLQRPEVRAKISESSKISWADPVLRKKQSDIQREINSRPEIKEGKSKKCASSWTDPQVREKRITNMIDSTVYNFRHNDGRVECCTRYALIEKFKLNNSQMSKLVNGLAKSHKGWRINE
jgi:hypothetical protein